jgi:hypothetical protein
MPPYRRNERACDMTLVGPAAQCRAVAFTAAVGKVAEVTGTSKTDAMTDAVEKVRFLL